MARPDLAGNVSADVKLNTLANSRNIARSPQPSIPEHAATSSSPRPMPQVHHYHPQQQHQHQHQQPPMVAEKESLSDYSSVTYINARPSRQNSQTSRPTVASPPPMSYRSTTSLAQQAAPPAAKLNTRGSVVSGHTGTTTVTTVTAAIEADPTNGWRPWWLRKRVLATFLVAFVVLVAVAEIIMVVCNNQAASTNVEGVWTFGPVIVMSVLAGLWARVEFQALNYAPWIVLDIDHRRGSGPIAASKSRQASRTLLLDYISLTYPTALSKAFRNQHYLAASSMVVSLLLRGGIFLSTGLFQLTGGPGTDKTLAIKVTMHALAGVLGLSAFFSVIMVLGAPGTSGITPRDPTTIAGTASLLANSFQPMSRLKASGNQDMDAVAQKVRGAWCTTLLHHPNSKPTYEYRVELYDSHLQTNLIEEKPIHLEDDTRPYLPWTHQAMASLVTIFVSIGLIAGLWSLYRIKGQGHRFEANGDFFFLWTSLVTLVFLILSMYISCIAFHVRRLAPYLKLIARACSYDESLGLAYTNELDFRSVLKSVKFRDWGVFMTTIAAILGWLLPIFSAGLFVDRAVEHQASVDLVQQTFFRSQADPDGFKADTKLVQDVLTNSTPTFPAWTYGELAYPSQHLAAENKQWSSGEGERRVMASVSATKATLDCQALTLNRDQGRSLKCKPLQDPDGNKTATVCEKGPYTGFTASSCGGLPLRSAFNYVWGACYEDASITVLMCNETFFDMNVQTTFVGEDLAISATEIPIADESTRTKRDIDMGGSENAYELLRGTGDDANATQAELLDGLDYFFRSLILSRVGVPRERLGFAERASSVATAIKLQHGIVRAQALNSDATRATFAGGDTVPAPVSGTVIFYERGLVQSAAQTALLTACLVLILALTLMWVLTKPSPAAMPKNPASIAAQASLLADSSLWWHLPRGVEWLSESKLARRLRRRTFRLGWFEIVAPGPDGTTLTERTCAIGVVQDDGRAMRAPWDEGEIWTASRRGRDWPQGSSELH